MVTDIVQFSLGTFLQPLWSSSDVLGPWRDLREDQQGCKQVPCENCMMSVTAFYPSLCVSQIWWILFTSPMVTKVCDIWVSIRRCVSQIWWILFCRFRLRGRMRLRHLRSETCKQVGQPTIWPEWGHLRRETCTQVGQGPIWPWTSKEDSPNHMLQQRKS